MVLFLFTNRVLLPLKKYASRCASERTTVIMSEPKPPHIKKLLTTYVNRNFYTEPIIGAQNNGNNESTTNTSTAGLPTMAHDITPPFCVNPVSNVATEEQQFFGHAAGLPTMAHITPPYYANPLSNIATGAQFFGHSMLSDFFAKLSMTTTNLTSHSSREPNSQCPMMYNDFRSPYGSSLVTAPPQGNYILPNSLTVGSSSENVGEHSVQRNLVEMKMRQLFVGIGDCSPTTYTAPMAHLFEPPQSCFRNSSTIDRVISLCERNIEEPAEDCTTTPSHQLFSQQFASTSSHQLFSQQSAYGDSTDGGSTDGTSTEMVSVGASSSLKTAIMSYTENTHQILFCHACPHLHFWSTTLFYKHYVTEHPRENKIQCEKCPRKFRSPVNFRDHLRDFHSDPNVFKCPECPAEYPRQHDFTLHYRRIHLELPPIQCKICREEFTYHTALDIHMKNVHSMEES